MNPASVTTNNARTWKASILRAAYHVFLTGGIVVLTYAGYVFVDAHSYQAREQNAFEPRRSRT